MAILNDRRQGSSNGPNTTLLALVCLDGGGSSHTKVRYGVTGIDTVEHDKELRP